MIRSEDVWVLEFVVLVVIVGSRWYQLEVI